MFDIKLTEGAVEDLRVFSRLEQALIVAEFESMGTFVPTEESESRKRLHPGAMAEWEVRIGSIRIFYDVNSKKRTVKVGCIGKFFYTTARPSSERGANAMDVGTADLNPDGEDQDDSPEADDFDAEIENTRASLPLVELLKERAGQPGAVSLPELRKQLLL
jgi:mRNA-degrading endonuclease RelE of RelBE toxin-antitoxin system